jgi:hypothetical protein
MPKLVPVPDDLSQPFWDAVWRRSAALQGVRHAPVPAPCQVPGLPVRGLRLAADQRQGHILSPPHFWTATWRPAQDQPHSTPLVALDDEPRIASLTHGLEARRCRSAPPSGHLRGWRQAASSTTGS